MRRRKRECVGAVVRSIVSLTLCLPGLAQSESSFRLVRSLSGPSGKVVGSKFVLDEVRNRFVYPDRRFVVYFEWDGPIGDHLITGIWKGPDGRTVSISSDIRLQTTTRDFAAYWTYEIAPAVPSGIWSLEVRIDGEPAGSHSFELIVPKESSTGATDPSPIPRVLTPDEIYRNTRGSLVWVHKLDESGRRIDTGSGFVLGSNQIATAFQVIDTATSIEVEFEGGRKVPVDEFWATNRLQDWAVLKADTTSVASLRLGDASKLAVAERLLVFNVEGNLTRAFGGVDLTGRRTVPAFGDRMQLTPAVSAEGAGGPLLNSAGEVVGVLGGSTFPGARFGRRDLSVSPTLYLMMVVNNAATPIDLVRVEGAVPATLKTLRESGILSTALAPMPSFLYGATSLAFKGQRDSLPQGVSEFSKKDTEIWVYSMWQRKDRVSKGMVSAEVYDAANRVRVRVTPKKISIPAEAPLRYGFAFSPQNLVSGPYRVDVCFDGRPIWRTFLTITD